MPTYEYRCQTCSRSYEVFYKRLELAFAVHTCWECGNQCSRVIGAGSPPIFKGEGFHCTDYRSDSYMKGAKGESETS